MFLTTLPYFLAAQFHALIQFPDAVVASNAKAVSVSVTVSIALCAISVSPCRGHGLFAILQLSV